MNVCGQSTEKKACMSQETSSWAFSREQRVHFEINSQMYSKYYNKAQISVIVSLFIGGMVCDTFSSIHSGKHSQK